MSPTKTNASESISRPRRVSTPTRKQRKRYKQKKIPKSLNGVASDISPRIFNWLTSRIASMYLRSQDGRCYERGRNVSHVPQTCLYISRLTVTIASNPLSCLNQHIQVLMWRRLKIQKIWPPHIFRLPILFNPKIRHPLKCIEGQSLPTCHSSMTSISMVIPRIFPP